MAIQKGLGVVYKTISFDLRSIHQALNNGTLLTLVTSLTHFAFP